ncbi:MAG TPA: hypothetical protein VFX09_00460 [Burkholderiales bacterium]|nr:hypothetical protein [Burkholderiales bacterium]
MSRASKCFSAAAGALTLLAAQPAPAASNADEMPVVESLVQGSAKSIAAWLRQSGREGYLAASVADAAGIPRLESEDMLAARQRGFRTGGVLRVAQVAADGRRDFLLFMVQRPGGEVYFYLASAAGTLKKAFVSMPRSGAIVPLAAAEAQTNYRREITYWQARAAGN